MILGNGAGTEPQTLYLDVKVINDVVSLTRSDMGSGNRTGKIHDKAVLLSLLLLFIAVLLCFLFNRKNMVGEVIFFFRQRWS